MVPCLSARACVAFLLLLLAPSSVSSAASPPSTSPVAAQAGSAAEQDLSSYIENTWRMGPAPARDVIDRIVERARRHPDDPAALYWAAQLGADGLTDRVPDFLELLRKSADRDFAPAMATYGMELCAGGGRAPHDVQAGLKLLTRARDKGEPTAFYQLGRLYAIGADGVPQNLDRAEDFLLVAVDKGITRALGQLAILYNTRGDAPRAMQYTIKAAEAGDVAMIGHLVEMYAGRTAVPLNDPARAVEWARRGALLDDPALLRAYAYMLSEQFGGLKKDPVLSRRLLRRAADLGDVESAAALQAGRVRGLFGVYEPRQGLAALERMSHDGLAPAKWYLGRILYEGEKGNAEVRVDRERGLQLIRAAAGQGFKPAQESLRDIETSLRREPSQPARPGGAGG